MVKASFPVDRVKKMENKRQDSMDILRLKATVTDMQVAAGVCSAISFSHCPRSPFFLVDSSR